MPTWSRRAVLRASLVLAAASGRLPSMLAPAGSILDGGPWICSVRDRSLAEGARVADSWARRGLRVVVALEALRTDSRDGDVAAWAEALAPHGWAQMKRRHGRPGEVIPWALRHPQVKRGTIKLCATAATHLLSGAEAAVLDVENPHLVQEYVMRVAYPWGGWMWIGTRYVKLRRLPTREEFARLDARIEALLRR